MEITLHLSDEEAAAISAEAAAEGAVRPIWQELTENMEDVPDELMTARFADTFTGLR
jgi:hypothetical protein